MTFSQGEKIMKYYLSVDAGGSKVHLLLFDEAFHRLDFEAAASANPNLTSKEHIVTNMRRAFTMMFMRNPQVKKLSCIYLCSVCPAEILLKPLDEFVAHERLLTLSEGEMGMYAGCASGSAVVTLSGTGSDIYFVKDNQTIGAIGGWGALIADEGSGYWIGREALIASIYDFEGRGESTLLKDMIAERLYPDDFRKSVFTIYETSSPARSIAAMSRIVDAAARAGDRIAAGILERAAALLCDQVGSIYRLYSEARAYKLMVTGGSWKNYLLFERFSDNVRKAFPGKTVERPVYEPIVGGAFCCAKEQGMTDAQARAALEREFQEDRYHLPE